MSNELKNIIVVICAILLVVIVGKPYWEKHCCPNCPPTQIQPQSQPSYSKTFWNGYWDGYRDEYHSEEGNNPDYLKGYNIGIQDRQLGKPKFYEENRKNNLRIDVPDYFHLDVR